MTNVILTLISVACLIGLLIGPVLIFRRWLPPTNRPDDPEQESRKDVT